MFRRTHPLRTPLIESDLAEEVPVHELEVLELLGTPVRFEAGRQAMVEDRVGRECMVVIAGSFVVERSGEWVAELQTGDFMGEMALLTSQPRNATVTAAEDSTVLAFSRREFNSLLGECPAIAAFVHRSAEARTLAA